MEHTTILNSFVSLLFLILVFKTLSRWRISRHKNLPPSPPSIPILGHLIKPPMHLDLQAISQKYGPIISLRFGSRLAVVVSSFEAAEECFTKNDVVFANRPSFLIGKHLGYNYTTLLQAHYGDHWRNLRRITTTEVFSSLSLNIFLPVRREEIKRLLKKLMSSGSRHEFSKVELKTMFSELTSNIIMRMLAGKRYYGDDVADEEEGRRFSEIVKAVLSYSGAAHRRDFVPILNWIDGGNFEKKGLRLSKDTDAFFQGLIDEHRSKKGGFDSANTVIDRMLSLQESQPDYYTDQIIKGIILDLLFAGTGTTASTLEWAMSNLASHPEVLEKARVELVNSIGENCLIDEHHLSKLRYLQSIISETLRLYPAAPLLVPHCSSDDCTIGGYHVSRGTILLVNAWAIHRDPKLWSDPTSFNPERFEIGKGESHRLMPFGLGRRACPGSGLAQRVIGLTLGLLIQCFEWRRVDKEKVDMTESRGISMPIVTPLQVMCKARPIMNNVIFKCN